MPAGHAELIETILLALAVEWRLVHQDDRADAALDNASAVDVAVAAPQDHPAIGLAPHPARSRYATALTVAIAPNTVTPDQSLRT